MSERAVFVETLWYYVHPVSIESTSSSISAPTFWSPGEEVSNVIIVNATREAGTIVFEPEFGPGEYHAYYLPHDSWQVGTEFWTVSVTYPAVNEDAVAPAWRQRATRSSGKLPRARFIELQPRVEFHRFTDMELIASAAETAALNRSHGASKSYLLFPEDRTNALRLTNSPDLPVRWGQAGPATRFVGSARRGEWYPFQVGVWSHRDGVTVTGATYTHAVASEHWTCINLGGIDETGTAVHKNVSIAAGHVNSLWFGVQIPIDAQPGTSLNGTITLQVWRQDGTGALPPAVVVVDITVSTSSPLYDHGDADVWRLSRLRWLDSTIGSDNSKVPQPYTPVQLSLPSLLEPRVPERKAAATALDMQILGRRVRIASSGLPLSLSVDASPGSSPTNVLDSAVQLALGDASTAAGGVRVGLRWANGDFQIQLCCRVVGNWHGRGRSDGGDRANQWEPVV